MGFLSAEDQAARKRAVKKNKANRKAATKLEQAKLEQAAAEQQEKHETARRVIVKQLFEDLKNNYTSGRQIQGRTSVHKQEEPRYAPSIAGWYPTRPKFEQHPVFAAMTVYTIDWDSAQNARSVEIAELQRLVDQVDAEYEISYDLEYKDIVDTKDGVVGDYIAVVEFMLKPRASKK